jgi:hypothetical protein
MSAPKLTAPLAAPENLPQDAHLKRMSIAAAEELRKTVRTALTGLMRQFLERLPLTLKDTAVKAPNPTERDAILSLGRTITANAGGWIETFVQHIDAHLLGGMPPERKAGDTVPTSADDSIALAQLELKAEDRYRKLVTELDARVNRLRLMLYVPVYTRALAPASLFRALHDTSAAMGWPAARRRLLVDHFNAIVVPELERMYRSLIEALTRIGTEAARATRVSDLKPEPPRPRQLKPATAMQAPADPTKVDAATLSMLKTLALKTDGQGYTDGLLAADLLALAKHRPLPGVAEDQSWVPLQRISTAGHFLNEVTSDPMIPEEQRPQHETVRFPLVKSALSDQSLFTAQTHPLGSMVHELLLKSAVSRITGNVETRRMAELLQQVLTQFDLAPDFVRSAMENGQPIEESQISRFFELQRQQAQQRRDFVISEAKRMVAKQLEQATFGRGVPPPAIKFLNTAWGPVLTKRLLQHGADHPVWKAGLDLMEQLLDQLDGRLPDHPAPSEWKELLQTMGKALVAEGMVVEQARTAISSLEAARKTPVDESGLGF